MGQSLGEVIRTLFDYRSPIELFRGDQNYQSFLEELKESHDIFNLSDFPMSLYKQEDHVSIGWYGGMPSGYDVIIFDKANPPKCLREYNVAYLYDTVAYYEIEDYAFNE